MLNKLGCQQRAFLDSILVVLSFNPTFNIEDDVYQKVCFEKTTTKFNGVKLHFDEFKEFLPKGSELLYFRLATRYLEANKLIFSNNIGDDNFQYIISYEGLLLSKNGGFKKEHSNNKLKSYLQNSVWIVTLCTFLYTSISFVQNTHIAQENSQLLHKLELKNNKQELKMKQLELKQVELLELKMKGKAK